jgi:hypothetical protein
VSSEVAESLFTGLRPLGWPRARDRSGSESLFILLEAVEATSEPPCQAAPGELDLAAFIGLSGHSLWISWIIHSATVDFLSYAATLQRLFGVLIKSG